MICAFRSEKKRKKKMSSCTYYILTCQAVTLYTHSVHMNVHYVEGVCWRGPLHDVIMVVLPESHSSSGDKQEDLRGRDECIHSTLWQHISRMMPLEKRRKRSLGRRGDTEEKASSCNWWNTMKGQDLMKWMWSLRWGQHRKLTLVNTLPSAWQQAEGKYL